MPANSFIENYPENRLDNLTIGVTVLVKCNDGFAFVRSTGATHFADNFACFQQGTRGVWDFASRNKSVGCIGIEFFKFF